jgi:predicted ATP-dependent serine protease
MAAKEYTCLQCGDTFKSDTKKCPNCLSREVIDSASEEAEEIRLIWSIERHATPLPVQSLHTP